MGPRNHPRPWLTATLRVRAVPLPVKRGPRANFCMSSLPTESYLWTFSVPLYPTQFPAAPPTPPHGRLSTRSRQSASSSSSTTSSPTATAKEHRDWILPFGPLRWRLASHVTGGGRRKRGCGRSSASSVGGRRSASQRVLSVASFARQRLYGAFHFEKAQRRRRDSCWPV